MSVIIILLLESVKWIADGRTGHSWFITNYIVNTVFLATSPVVSVLWLVYLDRFSCQNEKYMKFRYSLYSVPLILSVLLVLFSLKNSTVFSIDSSNIFSRQGQYIYLAFLNLGPIIVAIYILLSNKDKIERSSYKVFMMFNIIPITGALIQVSHYGILSTWSSVTLALLIIFFYVETKGLQKDHLTGVYNRRQLESYIRNKLKNSRAFTVLMIDLDDFKQINDVFGHLEGDKALIAVTNILTASIRNIDIAARYAGDEFVLIIENSSLSVIKTLIERISHNLEDYNKRTNNGYNLQMSIGYHIIHNPRAETLETVINTADEKMYLEKNTRKNLRTETVNKVPVIAEEGI